MIDILQQTSYYVFFIDYCNARPVWLVVVLNTIEH